ncbi:hypothetical protein J6590_082850 [Homalodisca vitripennis]|nr:hypothetical protein J6590_082850 [Homalodisca vitripennis]
MARQCGPSVNSVWDCRRRVVCIPNFNIGLYFPPTVTSGCVYPHTHTAGCRLYRVSKFSLLKYMTFTITSYIAHNVLTQRDAPRYTRLTDLSPNVPYRVMQFERCTTRIGETVMAILEDNEGQYRVFLSERYLHALTDDDITKYNNTKDVDRMSLKYLGRDKGIEFV